MINIRYALNPEVKISGLEFYQVASRFGLSEGRFIAGLPENWKRVVIERFRQRALGDIDAQRVSRALGLLKERGGFLKQRFDYDQAETWLDNVLRAKSDGLIERIISDTSSFGMSVKDILEHSLLDDSRDDKISWDADEMVRVAMPLLSMSEEFYIVDDYIQFAPGACGYSRFFSKPLFSLARRKIKISVFCKKKNFERFASFENFEERMRPLVDSHRVEFNVLEDHEESHARYIFSNKGGLTYDKGFRSSIDINQKYPVSYMSNSLREQLLDEFVNRRVCIEYTVALQGKSFK